MDAWISNSTCGLYLRDKLPLVPSTSPSSRPLRFLPSRRMTTLRVRGIRYVHCRSSGHLSRPWVALVGR
jgi:hypothetical protein